MAPNEYTSASIATIGSQTITLILEVDPTNETVAGWYQLNGGTVQPIVSNQTPIDVPSSFFDGVDHDANAGTAAISFAGISATHGYAAADPIDFDFSGFSITPLGGGSAQRGALAQGAPAPGGRASLLARPDESVRLAEPLRQTNLITSTLATTRTITYAYDGLSRLTGAVESGATSASYAYGYDLAGNRTSATVNGVTTTRSYNAANQVQGWSYDAAGNLLSDGATTYTYDALGRTTSQGGTSYAYNGDGVLVQAGATQYVQDLASPLSQVLSDGSASYVYGLDRLASSAGTWYLGDALGSVRQTLGSAGAVTAAASYDPWGAPVAGMIAPFGFTGEVQDSAGRVYLRARWYNAAHGTFTSRDPFAGWAEQPYGLHPYAYALGNPVLLGDPTGRNACEGHETATGAPPFGLCPDGTPVPVVVPEEPVLQLLSGICAFLTRVQATPIDVGIIIGFGASGGVGTGGTVGFEVVYDLYDFEVDSFIYGGASGTVGASVTGYVGLVTGWGHFREDIGVENYKGAFFSIGGGWSLLSGQLFVGPPSDLDGGRMVGGLLGVGPSADIKFRGAKFALPHNIAIPNFNVPVYKTLGEAAKDWLHVGSGSSKSTFHAHGTRKAITIADGYEFANYINSKFGAIPGFSLMMQSVVMHNAAAWEAQP